MALSASVSAYDFSSKDRNGIEIFYNINPDGKTVTVTYGGEKYNASNIEIPQEVSNGTDRYTVTAIGNRAFEQASVNELKLPDTITEFQASAFLVSQIVRLNYPKRLKHIRDRAFEDSKISNGILPEGLETIGDNAFYHTSGGLSNLDSISLPRSLQSIGRSAFSYNRMRWVKIPGNIKNVPYGAFADCFNLTHVELEEGVESIGTRTEDGRVFLGCPIESINFPSTLKYIGSNCFRENCLEEVVLPDNIEEIGEACFSSSKRLKSISFSKGMKEIPNSVCSYSTEIIKVYIPEGIEKIGNGVFNSASMLSHISLPESVTEVEPGAFSYTGLVDFTFPKNLTYVSPSMFYECDNLTEIIIPETIVEIGDHAFDDCSNLRKITLPDSLKRLGRSAFQSCNSLVDINIPASIGVLESELFYDCSALTGITIPEGIKKIDRYAFCGCTNLENVQTPKSLETIADYIFSSCNNLSKLVLYQNVSSVAQLAFSGCDALKEIHLYRAVLPETPIPQGWLVDRPVIPEGNSCTLYVPKGSGETYKASPYWNTFKEIIEVDMPENLNYQISFPYYTYGGSLTVNGETAKNVMEFAIGSDITISVVPQDGYHLKSLMLNGKDVLSEMTDRSYIIEKLDANYVVDAKFAENPVKLSLFMAVGGSVDVEIEKRATFSCAITPEDGWKVNTVTFNGRDVTSDLTDDNRYTTPSLIGDSELRVTFENVNSAVENIGVNATSTKVYVDRSGLVTIEGIESGTVVSAYAVNGQLVERITSSGDVATLQLYQHGIYLIQTPVKTYKIHY